MQDEDVIHIRIPKEEKQQAVRDAHRHGMNLTQYIRFMIHVGSALKIKN